LFLTFKTKGEEKGGERPIAAAPGGKEISPGKRGANSNSRRKKGKRPRPHTFLADDESKPEKASLSSVFGGRGKGENAHLYRGEGGGT